MVKEHDETRVIESKSSNKISRSGDGDAGSTTI